MSLPPLSSQGPKGRGRQAHRQRKNTDSFAAQTPLASPVENFSTVLTQNVCVFVIVNLAELHNFTPPPPFLHHPLLRFDTRNKVRLTSSVCRSFASFFIPANLCDHWGRIVHHIQLWFPALSSQSKVGKLSADTELLHEVNIDERRGARERRRENTPQTDGKRR